MESYWPFEKGEAQIWYMKPETFRLYSGLGAHYMLSAGIKMPLLENLNETHVLLGTMSDVNLEGIFSMMQGEFWAPNGKAKDTIFAKGLMHTSMMVGDIIVIKNDIYMVDMVAFHVIENKKEQAHA